MTIRLCMVAPAFQPVLLAVASNFHAEVFSNH
jgi:hypothetical protein